MVDPNDIQGVAELAAALDLGNERLESETVRGFLGQLQAVLADGAHYLFLERAGDPGSFSGCGSALGAAYTMVEDECVLHLERIELGACPNCRGGTA